MKPLGRHFLIELHDCNYDLINDISKIQEILTESAKRANATIIKPFFHKFSPQGISGVIIIAESHITIHTWPEYGYCAIDLFTCSAKMKTDESIKYLIKELEAGEVHTWEIKRGFLNPENYDKSIWRKYGKK